MTPDTLAALEAALAATPDNHLLREQLLGGHLAAGNFAEARDHAQALLRQGRASAATKLRLAEAFRGLGRRDAALMVTDELLEPGARPADAATRHRLFGLHLRLLLDEGRRADAQEQYQLFELTDADWSDPDLEDELKVRAQAGPGEGSAPDDDALFFEPPGTTFADVGGMEAVKDEIRLKIIAPLANPELFARYGKKAGGGILLYGPPGCGKTFIARATAGEIDARFMAIGLDDILSMWMGQSEANLAARFAAARRRRPAVVFVDEIDALAGKRRESLGGGAGMSNTVNAFLHELDGIDDDNEGLLVLGATNLPWNVDAAFLRPGRFDRVIFVPPPDRAAREAIFRLELRGKPGAEAVDCAKLAAKSEGFSGADVAGVVDRAVEGKLTEALRTGREQPLSTGDLLAAVKRSRPSVGDWLQTARNYVLYSNASGLYDDVKAYLKL